MLSDEQIRDLWRSPEFSGAFSGLLNFMHALNIQYNLNISRNKLFQIMKKDPEFSLETFHVKKRFPRRPYKVHGYCT